GAELASVLVRIGIPAHLFVDLSLPRLEQVLQALEPSILVVLDDDVIEEVIPASVNLCVTVRRSHIFKQHPQIDLYVVNELGLLGHSTDCATYSLNQAEYHFEQNESGRLIVTPLYNLLQPKIRIETLDDVELVNVGFDLVPGEHPIIPVMLGDAKLAGRMADLMLDEGIYVVGFSFPVVPKGKARIRAQMSAGHETEHLDRAIAAFAKVGRELAVIS
ncbi:MAG: aminotransferase class I/II-fold pyridoxal phosphate-dependent enzyme, partial [Proteobacteria bacterium]|nr:aminotransferase class I/II-fold pyridoxal phosphate-dependent enzyme [Pseudomonadota bacterium]